MPQTVEICYQGQWSDYRLFDAETMTFGGLTAYLLEKYQVNLNDYDGMIFNGRFVGERLGEFSYDMKMGRFFTTHQPAAAAIHLLRRRAQPTREQMLQYVHWRVLNSYPNRSLFSYHFEEWLKQQLVHAVNLPIDQLHRYVTLICQTRARLNEPLHPITPPYLSDDAHDTPLDDVAAIGELVPHELRSAGIQFPLSEAHAELESVRVTLAPALLARLPLCTFTDYQTGDTHSLPAQTTVVGPHSGPATVSFRDRVGCQTRCAICLEDFQGAETIRMLSCQHTFHQRCIDEWLTVQSVRCPLCRTDLRDGFSATAEEN